MAYKGAVIKGDKMSLKSRFESMLDHKNPTVQLASESVFIFGSTAGVFVVLGGLLVGADRLIYHYNPDSYARKAAIGTCQSSIQEELWKSLQRQSDMPNPSQWISACEEREFPKYRSGEKWRMLL